MPNIPDVIYAVAALESWCRFELVELFRAPPQVGAWMARLKRSPLEVWGRAETPVQAAAECARAAGLNPQVLLTWADPAVGHAGGLYRGAGAEYLGESAGGKLLFGWPLSVGERGAIA